MTKVLADSNQNFWQLACIQSSAQSVPGILLGWNLAKDFGAGTALISIFLGNLILWLIGLSIISMSSDKKIHALENVKDFLGKTSSIVAMLILSIAFMSWYVLAIKTSVTGIKNLFPIANQSEFFSDVRLGTVLGLITALIVIGGIGAIRKFCTWAFPFIFLFLCYTALYSNYNVDFSGSWGISLYAVLTCVAITLPGFINLPTFFRHSRSKADSFFALTLITLFDSTIASSSIIIGAQDAYTLNFKCFWQTSTTLDCGLSVIFIVLCLICLNLVNIYFVSAGGELIFYRYWNSKEYAIIGLLGTGAYAFLQVIFPMIFMGSLMNNFIAVLGAILLMSFLTRLIVRHRARPLEKGATNLCWISGCCMALVMQIYNPNKADIALISGVITSLICFLFFIFIEETFWSVRKVLKTNIKKPS